MNHPNAKRHLQISLFKSVIRIVGYILLVVDIEIAVAVLVASEVIGIIEELV
jgi:hypothetical protein|tara:strand:- start:26 stop:181 length:156 start_codon:yes stop_codon:yes gene_type:complete